MPIPALAPRLVTRLDSLSKIESRRDATGALRCRARIARSGVQTYVLGDGSLSVELRPESEVFASDSLSSFEAVPVTLEHPLGGAVTSESFRALARGAVSGVVADTESPGWVSAGLLIQDAEAISAVESGKVQLSAGYMAVRTPHDPPITWTDSEGRTHRVNATISQIRANHVALCDSARAGPGARLLLDSASPSHGVAMEPKPEVKPVEVAPVVEAKPEVVVDAKPEAKPEVVVDANVAIIDSLRSEVARLTADRERLAAQLVDATSPRAIGALVLERAVAVELAGTVGIKTDSLSTDAIRRAVLAVRAPGLKLDSFSPSQVADLIVALPTHSAPVEAVTTVVPQSNPSPVETARMERLARLGF